MPRGHLMSLPPPDRSPSDAAEDLTDRYVGRFRILARLGSGGMGEVYLADDLKLKRRVALKRLAPRLRSDPRYKERLMKEAERASALDFRYIAGLYDVLEEDGEVFLVMEYVEGVSFRQRLGVPMNPAEFFPIAAQCAEALAAAHQKGILHRDIKPENIMVTPSGQVKVLDFGLARRLPPDEEHAANASTSSRLGIAGTPGYMAPEILLEQEPDGRADIFSLGVVFYEALTGRHPFRNQQMVGSADRILHHQPSAMSQVNPAVVPTLEQLVSRMLAKEPESRYPSAQQLVADLQVLREGKTPLVTPLPTPRSRHFLRWAGGALLLGAATALAWMLWPRPELRSGPRDWVLIAEFDNKTGNPVFDHSLNTALSAYLQQSARVKVFPGERALRTLQSLGKSAQARIDTSVASQIAARERVPLVITGEIAAVGDRYLIVLQLRNPYDQSPLRSLSAEARGVEEVLPRLSELARDLRGDLGEDLARIRQADRPMEQVTTASLDALHSYSLARRRHMAGDSEAAVALYKDAIRADPDFALAYARLSAAYKNLGATDLSRQALTQAHRRIDRVSEPERYTISGMYHMQEEDYEQAREDFLALVDLHPEDASGHFYLSLCYMFLGEPAPAEKAIRRALELDPSPASRNNLANILVAGGKFREAIEVLEAARAQEPSSAQLTGILVTAYLGAGEMQKAQQQVDALLAGSPQARMHGQETRIRLLLLEGRWTEAKASLETSLASGTTPYEFEDRLILARLQLLQGQTSSALQELKRAEQFPDLTLDYRAALAAHYALTRQPAALGRNEEILRSRIAAGNRRQQAYLHLAQGARQFAQGDFEAAASSLRQSLTLRDSMLAHMLLAEALAASQHWQEAAGESELLQSRRGQVFQDSYLLVPYLLADYERGRAYQAQGDEGRARAAYTQFLRVLGDGSADWAPVRNARKRLRALGATPGNR